ncbi:MAG: aminoacetone oxidase family FAD-binding enzyme [Anaerolineaceae bacterium]|nr:aminoacetone oxidase family FAD-binding enzyme [Anaerolineaceae bacterium]
MLKLGIIGAGPAGIIASLEAKKLGADVLLFDSNEVVGRKLLVTGSGRCNLTNTRAVSEKYHASPISVVESVLSQFSHDDLIHYLHEMGILTHATSDGWVYPLSYSAANVANIFNAHLNDRGIERYLSHKAQHILPQKQGFLIQFSTGQPTVFVHKLLIASGGKAYPSLGSDGSMFTALRGLGHEIIPVQPALAPLVVPEKAVKSIQGVRTDAGIRLFENAKLLGESFGNIIFTKGGINGPGVMDISYLVSQYQKPCLKINFISGHEPALKEIFQRFAKSSMPLQSSLGAVVPTKIAAFALKSSGLRTDVAMSDLCHKDLGRIMECLSAFTLEVKGVRGFEYCQLSTGGIALNDIDPRSLESRVQPDLYFAGEILDVIGPCGGFNLQWAFSSGAVAGRWAAQSGIA